MENLVSPQKSCFKIVTFAFTGETLWGFKIEVDWVCGICSSKFLIYAKGLYVKLLLMSAKSRILPSQHYLYF